MGNPDYRQMQAHTSLHHDTPAAIGLFHPFML